MILFLYLFVNIIINREGMDDHFIENKTIETIKLQYICKSFDILEKIKHLEKPIENKMEDEKNIEILKDYFNYSDIKAFDIRAGGLMNDW